MSPLHLPNFRNINSRTVESLRNRLNAEPAFIESSNGNLTPGAVSNMEINQNKLATQVIHVDSHFLQVAGLSLKEGRNFSPVAGTDSAASIVVNETFVRKARLEDPVGQHVTYVDGLGNRHRLTIIGVVKDFHYASLKEKIDPVAMDLRQSEDLWVKMRKGETATGLAKLTGILNAFFPEFYQEYGLVDDTINNQYASDRKWKQIITYASLLSIIICCMGLIGLTHFETLRRTKEIAVRKVLGSSVLNISLLLSRDFLKLLTLSMLIGFPIAWFTMDRWLADFSYRIHISWFDFAISAFAVLLIALITVNLRAYGAAIASPLKNLRNE